jgi:hypothetical protein
MDAHDFSGVDVLKVGPMGAKTSSADAHAAGMLQVSSKVNPALALVSIGAEVRAAPLTLDA